MSIVRDSMNAIGLINGLHLTAADQVNTQPLMNELGRIEGFRAFSGGDIFYSALCWWARGEPAKLVITGVTTPRQCRHVVYGYGNITSTVRDAGGFNIFAWKDAEWLVGQIRSIVGYTIPIHVYGHSGGGMIAEAFAKQWKTIHGGRVERIITYGAPKPALTSFALEDRDITRIRWMIPTDPVPAIPTARLTNNAGYFYLLSERLIVDDREANVESFVHPRGGLLLGPTTIARGNDVRPALGINEAFTRWINGEYEETVSHSAGEYFLRLARIVGRHRVNPDAALPAEGGAGATTPTPGIVIPFTLPFQQEIEARQNVVMPLDMPAQIPNDREVIPLVATPRGGVTYGGTSLSSTRVRSVTNMAFAGVSAELRFTYTRVNKVFIVHWMNQTIAQFDKATCARTFIRTGNRFLRVMGNHGSWLSVPTINALTAFLATASQSGQGYEPPLVVDSL